MYHRMTLVFVVCFARGHWSLYTASLAASPRIKPCMLFLGDLISYNPVTSTIPLLLLLFHNDLLLLHYLCSRTPPHSCCSCSSACGSQHPVNNRACNIRQHVRQRKRLAQWRRMLKRGERSRNTIPDIRRSPHLPFYRRRARHCVELA